MSERKRWVEWLPQWLVLGAGFLSCGVGAVWQISFMQQTVAADTLRIERLEGADGFNKTWEQEVCHKINWLVSTSPKYTDYEKEYGPDGMDCDHIQSKPIPQGPGAYYQPMFTGPDLQPQYSNAFEGRYDK